MKEYRRPLLVPQYMHSFNCIGSECEDSCCIGWRVVIDKDTYKKYKSTHHPELSPLLKKNISRIRSKQSSENYAKIKLQNGSCPFLTEKHLCQIQLELGEEYLSNVCTTYPRITNEVNGILEKSATVSCPEAARLALLNPEIMEFDEVSTPVSTINMVKKRVDTHALKSSNKPLRYFWQLRIFTIDTLQNRHYSLEERLIILGLFYQKLQKYVDAGQVHEIPSLIAKHTIMMQNDSIKETLKTIPAQNTIQMELLKELAELRFTMALNSKRYLECFAESLHGIQYTAQAEVEEIGKNYQEALERYYLPFMHDHHYILENYLVNHVFKNIFPFNQENLYESYIMLVVHYSLIKLHLIGMSGFHKGLTQELVIKLIQSFAKTAEHNQSYLHKILDLLKKNSYSSIAWMAIMIMN
ncbi:MAG: flagellin lysine-N-methylase [Syntrophaceticus sp.]|nr:flagellin lysine-N-methylase [Syntrophaceticus sp.]MDD4360260.1 flagellin lysine-N-methylase [Syntrophaceticus sp.]